MIKVKDSSCSLGQTIIVIAVALVTLVTAGLITAGYLPNPFTIEESETQPQPHQPTTPPPTAKAQKSPEIIVQEFYDCYLASEGEGPVNRDCREAGYLSEEFLEEVKNTRGFDPLLCAQDTPTDYAIGTATIQNNTAQLNLEQRFGNGKRLLPIELEKVDNQWVITAVKCAEEKPQQGLDSETTIIVYFANEEQAPSNSTDCSLVYGTQRTIEDTSQIYQTKLNELFRGPTKEEKAAGFSSFFSQETADILKDVIVKGDTAYVNLTDIRDIIPSVSSSCGYQQFNASVSETLKYNNFNIENVIFAINGDPETFYEWVQIGCTEENNFCDPGPLER